VASDERKHKCGWCITNDHAKCKVVTVYYDKEWRCECGCQKPKREG
jgi:hypothetical protein